MKSLMATICIVTFVGVSAHMWAKDKTGSEPQIPALGKYDVEGDLMECSPPKFFLVSEVDLESGTILGFKPKTDVVMFGLSFHLANVQLSYSNRTLVADDRLKELEGSLVVMTTDAKGLSAAYLDLLRDDTVVLSVLPSQESE